MTYTNLSQHIVKKLVIELTMAKQKEALHTQDKLISVAQDELLIVIDKVFTEAFPQDIDVQIDRLELDLGRLNKDELVTKLCELLEVKLREEIEKKASLVSPYQHDPEARSLNNLILHYLKYGYYPWWNKGLIHFSDIFAQWLENADHKALRSLFKTLTLKPAYTRWIRLVDRKQKIECLERYASDPSSVRVYFEQKYKIILPTLLVNIPQAEEWFWILVLEYQNKATELMPDFNQIDAQWAHQLQSQPLSVWKSIWQDWIESEKLPELMSSESVISEILLPFALQEGLITEPQQVKLKEWKIEGKIEYSEISGRLDKTPTKDHLSKSSEKKEMADEEVLPADDEVFIRNTGLVLFWPYLSAFFKALGLLDNGTFKDDTSRIRAIFLLQYLATGREGAEEHELYLNKVMCGWDMTQALETVDTLTQEEKEEAANLTQAVIGHWQALKNTSSEGLRETFVMREGIITHKNGMGWQIRVERKGVDILMGSLPWGLSMITFPWTREMIQVDW